MHTIVAGIVTLVQHIKELSARPSRYHPVCCPSCGKSGLWRHGVYHRKADRTGKLDPVPIPRFYCPHCHKTCSALPECIPPRRWYLWEIQQIALSLLLSGKSAYAVAKEHLPARATLCRWMTRLKEQIYLHKDTLCNHFADLGRTTGFTDFWQATLGQLSLAQAMRLCHVGGVVIP